MDRYSIILGKKPKEKKKRKKGKKNAPSPSSSCRCELIVGKKIFKGELLNLDQSQNTNPSSLSPGTLVSLTANMSTKITPEDIFTKIITIKIIKKGYPVQKIKIFVQNADITQDVTHEGILTVSGIKEKYDLT